MLIRDLSFIKVPQPVHIHGYCKWHQRVSVVDICLGVDTIAGDGCHENSLEVLWRHVHPSCSVWLLSATPPTWTCMESPAVLFLCLPRGRCASQNSWVRAAHFIPYKAIGFWRLFLLCMLYFWMCACVCQLRISNYGVSDLTGPQSIWASW